LINQGGNGQFRDNGVGQGQNLVSEKLKRDLKAVNATAMLKNEIKGSQLRVKAAKYGHRLEDIVPPYNDAFYLPDKNLYFTSTKFNKQSRNESMNAGTSTSVTLVNNQNDITN